MPAAHPSTHAATPASAGIEFFRVLAAAEGRVGRAAAACAQLTGDVADQVAGFQAFLDEVLRHGSHDGDGFAGGGQ